MMLAHTKYSYRKNEQFDHQRKNSLDLYSSLKSIYLQNRENKIRNSIQDEDEWGNLDN